ncbi:MAG: hypothetical protein HY305_06790 [Sphingobacteriales bacterium]|nr:hypothetical protein [Sphingobacteriales bacterium]
MTELLAGTWVGCDDPFLKIYSGTAGGSEMALPKWGYFMNKVYSDRKLPYGKTKDFIAPQELMNDPIYADQNFAALFNKSDSIHVPEDQGNGDAGDFGDEPTTEDDLTPIDNNKTDTGRTKDKKNSKKATPAIDDKKKAAIDKNKSASSDY